MIFKTFTINSYAVVWSFISQNIKNFHSIKLPNGFLLTMENQIAVGISRRMGLPLINIINRKRRAPQINELLGNGN